MRRSLHVVISATILSALPVQAQVSQPQVSALVEALRLAAPQTGKPPDGMYTDWQILPGNIPRWSKSCLGRELTPAQLEADSAAARSVVTCVIKDVLAEQQPLSGGQTAIAVRRVAAWWMTGDANRYASGETATYTEKVWGYYQQQSPTKAEVRPAQPMDYDLYMRFGYSAAQKRDYAAALVNFRRALQERPGDPYATQAIRNVESYSTPAKPTSSTQPEAKSTGPSQPASTPNAKATSTSTTPAASTPKSEAQAAAPASPQTATTSLTQEQAIALINRWMEAKQQIFAPPFDRQPVVNLTTGQLYVDLNQANGVIDWLQRNNAYYRFGVQKLESVDKFVAAGNKATLEVKLTEDRTLYRNGKVDPSQTDFVTHQVRFSLQAVDGHWKIADYKTVQGGMLERSLPQ